MVSVRGGDASAGAKALLGEENQRSLASEIERAARGTAAYIVNSADFTHNESLWPADSEVFSTNPLSLAYGACGPLLFLHRRKCPIPADVMSWSLKQPIDWDAYPPGLYVGLAGIAYVFQKIGYRDKAEEVMATLQRSPLLFSDSSMMFGAAGWGLINLHFYVETTKPIYLDFALRAARHLKETAQSEGETLYWPSEQDGRIHYGFGHGSSGIALFLAYLHVIAGGDEFRAAAIRALEFDLEHKVETELGLGWRRYRGDSLTTPYWIHGGSGVCSVVIRLWHLLRVDHYRKLACEIADDCFVKYSVLPGLFNGLTGIGELMLDMYRFTHEAAYLDKAFDIAETILWFKLDKPEGVAWPGQWLTQISNDYFTGAAGIGMFLTRLLRPADRACLDLISNDAKQFCETRGSQTTEEDLSPVQILGAMSCSRFP